MKISKGDRNLYQPISAANWPLPIITLEVILLCFVLGYFWDAAKKNNKNSVKVAFVSLAVMLALIPVVGVAFEKDDANKAAMSSNILAKYNDKYSSIPFPYLKNVEYAGSGGKYETGRYFTLTYGDDSTERIKFLFSDKTGEPRCFCDLKHPRNFVMTPEINEHLKVANDRRYSLKE